MSSTDGKAQELFGRFFDEVLAPVARDLQAQGQPPFPLKGDPGTASYWLPRAQTRMVREDFLAPSCLEPEAFEPALEAHWRAVGRTRLLAETSRLQMLAQAAKEARASLKSSAELSPDLYVMF